MGARLWGQSTLAVALRAQTKYPVAPANPTPNRQDVPYGGQLATRTLRVTRRAEGIGCLPTSTYLTGANGSATIGPTASPWRRRPPSNPPLGPSSFVVAVPCASNG